ncbi:hypothetical protein OBBRIDRAFT_856026 [Obba rivulosa]|uniref:Uncharacterized protein n=1 Tax=Obba rivulosa TaxID=1052685 RepID=A0A8E2AT18_9APHY|nr:hypothetical protein OBBRIDRAFT_856026 [Obba rivulosa]
MLNGLCGRRRAGVQQGVFSGAAAWRSSINPRQGGGRLVSCHVPSKRAGSRRTAMESQSTLVDSRYIPDKDADLIYTFDRESMMSILSYATTAHYPLYAWKYIGMVDLGVSISQSSFEVPRSRHSPQLFSKNNPDTPIAVFSARKPPNLARPTLIIKPSARHMEVAVIFSLMDLGKGFRGSRVATFGGRVGGRSNFKEWHNADTCEGGVAELPAAPMLYDYDGTTPITCEQPTDPGYIRYSHPCLHVKSYRGQCSLDIDGCVIAQTDEIGCERRTKLRTMRLVIKCRHPSPSEHLAAPAPLPSLKTSHVHTTLPSFILASHSFSLHLNPLAWESCFLGAARRHFSSQTSRHYAQGRHDVDSPSGMVGPPDASVNSESGLSTMYRL